MKPDLVTVGVNGKDEFEYEKNDTIVSFNGFQAGKFANEEYYVPQQQTQYVPISYNQQRSTSTGRRGV